MDVAERLRAPYIPKSKLLALCYTHTRWYMRRTEQPRNSTRILKCRSMRVPKIFRTRQHDDKKICTKINL